MKKPVGDSDFLGLVMARLLLWSQMFVAVVLIGLIVWVLWLMSKMIEVGIL